MLCLTFEIQHRPIPVDLAPHPNLIHEPAASNQMSTSTYALPVKTAILPESNKHERRKVSMQSSTIRSPSGSVRSNAIGIGKAGTTLSANGQHVHDHHANSQHARRTSASNNVLGIDGAMRWDSKGTVVGPAPAPAAKGDRHRRGLSDLGRRFLNFPLQTTFPNSPMSPRTPLSAKYVLATC